MPFFLIFVVIPMAEIMLFMAVGEHIGFFTTLFMAFLTAVIGGWIVKYQGLHTLADIRRSMDAGQIPLGELFDGICLIIAGATLITPGFLTDFIGFALLVPPIRNLMRAAIRKHTTWGVEGFGTSDTERASQTPPPGDILEGEYERVDDKGARR